ncbi:putative quinol monooxygenase [Nocardioides mangrovi]|uniref:Antibiotic biosynthesis monooxygenase n=1 Tax=Nocardioides mangrovi TaxID=2874580 RepID=A0ABS7U850_9ACTN|nr:antibiotic biosynthesis monooxygenase [Nocardioides mangrovi]MBZ5737163.1 antibiotic biosynthesis monooxygenase [Nocardioides mangrovi]
MLVARFKVQVRPEYLYEMAALIAAVEAPSRELPGVVEFDVLRSLSEQNTFVVNEVFEDRQALERQNLLPEVAAVLDLVGRGALTRDLEWTVWDATESL